MPGIKDRIEELRKIIARHEHAYYAESNPLISDGEFDKLMAELRNLEEANPEFKSPNSPTQRVGGAATSFESAPHRIQMLSLDNAYSLNELQEWIDRMKKNAGDSVFPIICELKIDGVSISLNYSNGEFLSALTRGDGETGDLVTTNVRTIRSLPLNISDKRDMDLRGEIYIPRSRLVELNRIKFENGEEPFKNCRNLASGTLKNLDPKISLERGIRIWLYDIAQAFELGFKTHEKVLDFLSESGFSVCEVRRKCHNLNDISDFLRNVQEIRDKLDFDIDGAVLKVDSLSTRNELADSSKAPRWAIAYKFAQQQVKTKIRSIVWQVGRSQLTPVANLEPVELGGTTVSRASLHNLDQIREKDIRSGDSVLVEKAGYIIPYVVCSLPEERIGNEAEIQPPLTCPSCNGPIKIEKNGPGEDASTVITCSNSECQGVLSRKVLYFVENLEIENIGGKLVEKLIASGLVNQKSDIFRIRKEDLLQVERMGEKLADKILANIEKARKVKFSSVIAGLGIPNIGSVAAEEISRHFRNISELTGADISGLLQIPGIGEKMASAALDFLKNPANQQFLRDLESFWKGPDKTDETTSTGELPLNGKTFVITGEATLPRRQLEELVKKNGGRVSSSVSSKTDFLVIGSLEPENFSSTKKGKALDLKIPIINELKLVEMAGK
ncbi:MAG: NAD-dependent DNA ligase LigA [Candidatus Riflebacteria bacterium]|nr:NAD-dependent DNA ligase LigA [Candidatus Riflebacteria bacterium]